MEKQKTTNKRHVRNDIILVSVLLLFAIAFGIYLFFFRATGDAVKVTVNGKPYATYSLSENREVNIYTRNNQQLNRLIVKDGKAFIETATCPDKICAEHRAIFRDGESIVCLPNHVVVTVIKSDKTDAPDAVT
jgi:hypothetical protein